MSGRSGPGDDALLARAEALLANTWSPYSTVRVAAVVLLDDGTLHDGVNVENSSLGLTICAERNALFAAVTGGMAVDRTAPGPRAVTLLFTSNHDDVRVPCGACRQVIGELAPGAEIVYGRGGVIQHRWPSIAALLPEAFDGSWRSAGPGKSGA